MAKRACVILAEGFEEVEAVTPIDYLRRAGIEVSVLGVGATVLRGARGISVTADKALGAWAVREAWDVVVVPGGGPGAKNIAASPEAVALLKAQAARDGLIAAICASPAVVLHGACGLLTGRRFTGYPGTETLVSGATFVAERVVEDGNLITSRGAGCAGEFAVAVIRRLSGEAAAAEVAEKVLLA